MGLFVNNLCVCYSANSFKVKVHPDACTWQAGIAEAFLPPDLDSSGIDIGQSYSVVSIRECRVSAGFNETHLVFLNFEQKPTVLLSKPTKGFGNNNVS